jgi:hypothetical protein
MYPRYWVSSNIQCMFADALGLKAGTRTQSCRGRPSGRGIVTSSPTLSPNSPSSLAARLPSVGTRVCKKDLASCPNVAPLAPGLPPHQAADEPRQADPQQEMHMCSRAHCPINQPDPSGPPLHYGWYPDVLPAPNRPHRPGPRGGGCYGDERWGDYQAIVLSFPPTHRPISSSKYMLYGAFDS